MATSIVVSSRVSIHAFRGEGDWGKSHLLARMLTVSIHAFRGEGDEALAVLKERGRCFNPRLPGGRRRVLAASPSSSRRFQSTPSGGKATAIDHLVLLPTPVSIHAFRGEGDLLALRRFLQVAVSIHAFRGEGDRAAVNANSFDVVFQSTPSGGKATCEAEIFEYPDLVSIHAFRGEGDGRDGVRDRPACRRFNPRLPGGRRHRNALIRPLAVPFQSTPSGGKATYVTSPELPDAMFQSTPSGGKATGASCVLRTG